MPTLVAPDLHLGSMQDSGTAPRPTSGARAARGGGRPGGGTGSVVLGDGPQLRENAPARTPPSIAALVSRRPRAPRWGPDGSSVQVGRQPRPRARAGWSTVACRPTRRLPRLEQRIEPARPARSPRGSPSAPRPRRAVAYPGLWLRDDVYAIHGHYADLHTTVPTFERLAAGAMARWVVRLPEDGATPTTTRPRSRRCTRGCTRSTQRSEHGAIAAAPAPRRAPGSRWRATAGAAPAARRRARRRLRGRGRGAQRAGLGPIDRDLSGPALRRGYLRGMREVLRAPRRRAPARDLGPLAPRRPVAARRPAEWTTPAARGSSTPARWVYQPHFLSPSRTARPTGRAPRPCSRTSGPPSWSRCWATRGTRSCAPRA
jgi:hypothetical protein